MTILFISPPFGNYFPEWFINKYVLNNNTNTDTKSIVGSFTAESRSGLFSQIVKTLRYSNDYGGWVNKIGLRNKGIDWAIEKYYKQKDIIVSVAIIENKDIINIANKIPEDLNIEVNISCPNVDKSNYFNDLNYFLNPNREWCIIKLSPLVTNNEIDALYENGWRQYHCCNTIPVCEGGLSGKSIKPYTLKHISYISDKYPDATIIAGGGIENLDDINEYKKNGAHNYSVSTVLFNPYKFYLFLKSLNV